MDIFDKLRPLSLQIQEELQHSIKKSFPKTLKEPIQYFLNTPGKNIRPLFTLLCAQFVGGDVQKALPAAAGIELFHDFTLIHDDIMDRDDLRRGHLTIHKKWDEGTAILVGDALVGMAYESMLKCEKNRGHTISKLFSQALIRVCEGQALDKEFENRPQVNPDEYLDMITKKTAWLLKLSCQVGGILGNGSANQVELLSDFGNNLGIGFQIQDDLLDFVADEEKLGKNVGSDFRMDKKTYVTLKYQWLIKQQPELLPEYPANIWEFDSLDKLKKSLFELGLVKEIQSVVDTYFENGLEKLAKVKSSGEDCLLYQLVDFLRHRQY